MFDEVQVGPLIAQIRLKEFRLYWLKHNLVAFDEFIVGTSHLPEEAIVALRDGVPALLVNNDGFLLRLN